MFNEDNKVEFKHDVQLQEKQDTVIRWWKKTLFSPFSITLEYDDQQIELLQQHTSIQCVAC